MDKTAKKKDHPSILFNHQIIHLQMSIMIGFVVENGWLYHLYLSKSGKPFNLGASNAICD